MVRRLGGALVVSAAMLGCTPAQWQDAEGLERLAASPHRSARNVARDGARHPVEVLKFFGVRPHHSVVEILPGSAGYYMEILAPYLREKGRYIAADRDRTAAPQYLADHERLLARLKAEPAL
ncbi:MAG TPA: methyltransferase, partial [Burkholderiales bacterium]|nr:methyltransferase [Burkholderiales bacterium]